MNVILKSDIEYKQWLTDLKFRIRNSQIKAALKVNAELINLYWELGKEIVSKQEQSQWGDGLIKQLSSFIVLSAITSSVYANTIMQDVKITINRQNAPISRVLDDIEEQTG